MRTYYSNTWKRAAKAGIRLLGAAFFSLQILFFTSCDKDVFNPNTDPFKGQTYVNNLTSPISTLLEEDGSYTEYVGVLKRANMFSALNQSSNGVSFTALVPNNEAMQAFYHRRGFSSYTDMDPEYLRQFVLTHTVKDSILPEAFVMKKTLTNLSGDELSVVIDSLHAGQAVLNDEGRVVEMGISAFNGKIYVLSSVITPLVETVFDRIVDAGQSSIMVQAIQSTGWEKRLRLIVDTTFNADRQRVITHYYYTVLNVTDATFAKTGIQSIDQLKSTLKANDSRGLTEDSLLNEYVSYHILKNSYLTEQMGAMAGSDTLRIWGTSAANQVFSISYDSTAVNETDKYIFNAAGQLARFVPESSNVLAKNGYVHELDSWLPVWEPQQSTIVWDLADYAEIKNKVVAAGVSYQPAEVTQKEERADVSSTGCFEIELGEAGTTNTTYGRVDYVTCSKVIADANNNDRMVFNIGYMGKITMQTPTIIRGKYKVELNLVYTSSNAFMRQKSDGNGGMLKMTFDDGDPIFIAPYTKIKATTSLVPQGIYEVTLTDEIEFSATGSHQFSFTVLDPAASSNKNFSLQFDVIKFTPIE